MADRRGNNGNSDRLYFLGSKITADGDCSHDIKRHLLLGRKAMINVDSILKSRDVTLLTKICLVKARAFSKSCMDVRVHWVQFSCSLLSNCLRPHGLQHARLPCPSPTPGVYSNCERWTIKKAEHQKIDAFELVLEKTLESPLDSKEIKPVSPKGNQSWIFIGRTDAEAPIFWPPDVKNWLIGKTLILGKIEGRSVALKVREQVMRMKTEHEIWCNGSRDLQPLIGLRCRVHSWVQLLFLIADYETFFDLSFPRHYIDTVQILFLPQAIPFWDSLGNNEQVRRQWSYLTPTWCSKVHAFMIPVILPSRSGLGVCNKSKKNIKNNHQHSFLIYAVIPGAISMKFLKAVKVHY